MRHTSLKVLISMGAFLASTSFAAAAADPAELALINKVGQGKLAVLNTFPGPGNLHGFVLQPEGGGQPVLMYVDDKARYAVYGAVIDKDGKNVTEQDTETYVKKYIALKISDNLAETTQVKEGRDDAPYKIIALADPNCSACHYFYEAAKPMIDNGQLQVNWIFVYFVQADSKGKAAAIMAAKDPGKAMAENEAGFDGKTEEGGIEALKVIPKNIEDQLNGNMKFMQDTGMSSTPTLIFYGKNKSGLQYINGAPSDMKKFLEENAPRVTSK